MNWDLSLSLLLPVVVGIIGWGVGHWLSTRRDQDNARRQWVLENLVSAFRDLESLSNRPDADPRVAERVVREIQLWGTPEQAKLAAEFGRAVAAAEADTVQLLNGLRDHIRRQLRLEKVDTLQILRFEDGSRTPWVEEGGSKQLGGPADGSDEAAKEAEEH